jgi:hypothetical protein
MTNPVRKTASVEPCLWPTGTASSGPKDCLRPAKAIYQTCYTNHLASGEIPVCGIHQNKARRYGWASASDDDKRE